MIECKKCKKQYIVETKRIHFAKDLLNTHKQQTQVTQMQKPQYHLISLRQAILVQAWSLSP